MGKQKLAQTNGRSADALVKHGGKAEKRLLRLERRAERLLTEARARLRKAQLRLERRLSAVSDAEALLRTRQAARASGPHESNGTSSETPPPVATATEQVVQASKPAKAVAKSPAVVPASKAPASKTSANRTPESKAAAVNSKAPSTPPPAAKPLARRTASKPAAPKEQAS